MFGRKKTQPETSSYVVQSQDDEDELDNIDGELPEPYHADDSEPSQIPTPPAPPVTPNPPKRQAPVQMPTTAQPKTVQNLKSLYLQTEKEETPNQLEEVYLILKSYREELMTTRENFMLVSEEFKKMNSRMEALESSIYRLRNL